MKKWTITFLIIIALTILGFSVQFWFSPLLTFVGANSDVIQGLTDLLQLLLWATGAVLFIGRVRAVRTKSIPEHEYFPFQIITEPGELLPSLLPGPGLMPEYKLPYHRRQTNRNITEELRTELFSSQKLLVTGVAGLGKTREVGKLLSNLIDEGFTVLRARSNARFDQKIYFPDSLRHSLVFLFDDMHQRCADPSMSVEQDVETQDFLDSLRLFLQRAETRYSSEDIYAIFVSRSDTESWDYLQFPSHPFWQSVARYRLPYPDIDCQKEFVLSVAARLQIEVDKKEAMQIAEANDRTFRNLTQNLYRAKRDNIPLTLDNFVEGQRRNWSNRYESLCNKYPREIPPLFDILSMLSDIGIPLYPSLVADLTTSLLLGLRLKRVALPVRWLIRRKVLQILDELVANGDLLVDSSGSEYVVHELMLSVKGTRTDVYRLMPMIWHFAAKLPDRPFEVWINLASYAIQQTLQLKLGIQILTTLLRLDPEHAKARHLRGMALFYVGFEERAIDDLDVAHEVDPEDSVILNTRGMIHGIAGHLERAERDLNKAALLDPENSAIFLNRANVWMLQEDFESAEADLNRAIRLLPEYAPYYVTRAQIRWTLGDRELAQQDLETALEKRPGWASVYIARAEFYLTEDQQLDAAEREIDKAIEIAPELPTAYFTKAAIVFERNEYELAEQLLNQAIEYSPYNSEYYYARADVRQKLGRNEASMADLNSAIGLNHRDPRYFTKRGIILSRMGVIGLAQGDLEYSLEFTPNNPEVLLGLAWVYGVQGRYEEALVMVNRCLDIDQDRDDAYHTRAHLFIAQRQFQAALEDLDKAVELAPENAGHFTCRGILRLQYLGQQRRVVKDLALAKQLSPEEIQRHIRYIACMRYFNRDRRVKNIYLREINKQPDNPVILVSYAYICALDGEFVEAEEYLRRSFEFQIDDFSIIS